MSVGAIGAVGGASPASPTQKPMGSQKPASAGHSNIRADAGGHANNSNHAQPTGISSNSSDNMSTRDFISLAEQVGKGNNETKDIMDMMKMIVALQIMQKTIEATGKIIDSFIKGE